MSDILQANIFFFITSVATIALAVLWVIISWYLIAILRDVHAIVTRARAASADLERDLRELRSSVRQSGERVRSLGGLLFDFFVRMLTKPARRSQKRTTESESETGTFDTME